MESPLEPSVEYLASEDSGAWPSVVVGLEIDSPDTRELVDQPATLSRTKLLHLARKWLRSNQWILAAILLGTIMGAAVATVFFSSNSRQRPVCYTAECRRQAALTLSWMNDSADPCSDFYQFACGAFSENQPMGGRPSLHVDDVIGDFMSQRLQDILLATSDQSAFGKAKFLYKSCLHAKASAEDYSYDMLQLVRKYGGFGLWNVDFHPLTPKLTLQQKLGAFLLNHALSPFFTLSKLDEHLYVMSFLMMPHTAGVYNDRYYQKALDEYKETVTSALNLFIRAADSHWRISGQINCNSSCVDRMVYGIIQVESVLSACARNNSWYDPDEAENRFSTIDPNSTDSWLHDHLDSMKTKENITLVEIDSVINIINVSELVRNLFRESIDNSTVFIVPNQQFLETISDVLSMPEHTLDAYLLWILLREFLVILGPRYSQISDNVAQGYGSWERTFNDESPQDQCLTLLETSMPLALQGIFKYHYIGKHNYKHLNDITREVVGILSDRAHWVDTRYRSIVEDMSKTTLHHSVIPSDINDETTLDEYYSTLKFTEFNFFATIIEIQRFLVSKMSGSEIRLNRFIEHQRGYLQTQIQYAYAMKEGSHFLVPDSFLQPPWFSDKLPDYINAAGIGFKLLTAMTRRTLFLLEEREISSNEWLPSLIMWQPPPTDLIQEQARRMLRYVVCWMQKLKQSKETNTVFTHPHILSASAESMRLPEYEAFKMAFRLHKHLQKKSKQDISLVGLEKFSADQMFFLVHAQNFCSNGRYLGHDSVPFYIRAVSAVTDNEDGFHEAFNCPAHKRSDIMECSAYLS